MKLKLAFAAVTALLGTVSLAAPNNYQRNDTHESPRRAAYAKQPRHHPKYITTGNWAGAVKHGHKIQEASGWLIVPNITAPDDGQEYGMAAWVGIDGTRGCKSLLQTGIKMEKHSDGSIQYVPWYEWYPQDSVDLPWIEIRPGDTIEMNVSANSETSGGSTTIINHSLNQNHTETFDALPEGVPPLCRKSAVWIVEGMTVGYYQSNFEHERLDGFPDFGSLQFTDTRYLSHDGYGTSKGADVYEIDAPGMGMVTSCGLSGVDHVDCTYIGPTGGAPGHENWK